MRSAHCWTPRAHNAMQEAVQWYPTFCLLPFSRANFPEGKVTRAILATYQPCSLNYSQTPVHIVQHLCPWIIAHFFPYQANDTASTAG